MYCRLYNIEFPAKTKIYIGFNVIIVITRWNYTEKFLNTARAV